MEVDVMLYGDQEKHALVYKIKSFGFGQHGNEKPSLIALTRKSIKTILPR